jgi:hypothetical protein
MDRQISVKLTNIKFHMDEQISVKFPNIKFHENQFTGSRGVSCIQIDGRTNRVSELRTRAAGLRKHPKETRRINCLNTAKTSFC